MWRLQVGLEFVFAEGLGYGLGGTGLGWAGLDWNGTGLDGVSSGTSLTEFDRVVQAGLARLALDQGGCGAVCPLKNQI